MENAAKALEMAGSVLIGLMILGCLVFVYSNIAEVKKVEQTSEMAGQSAEFNKDYDAYNRDDLYGSDMFSLANLIENYNIKESDEKDYGKIEIKIKLKSKIIGATFFKELTYTNITLNENYKNLTSAIQTVNIEYFGKAVSYWANFGTGSTLENQLLQELRK
ncbi:MAG: hypothetical protein ACI4VC_05690 [Clostridia bacterium]